LLISLEKFRMYIIHHGMMVPGWTKILADCDQVAVCLSEVPKKTADFLLFFPEPHHEAAFGDSFGMQPLCFFQEPQGSLVVSLRPNGRIEAGHGFQVVIENRWLCLQHSSQGLRGALEIRDQNLNQNVTSNRTNSFDCGGKVRGTTIISKIIASNRGKYHIFEVES
jgi:hypothetical protein